MTLLEGLNRGFLYIAYDRLAGKIIYATLNSARRHYIVDICYRQDDLEFIDMTYALNVLPKEKPFKEQLKTIKFW